MVVALAAGRTSQAVWLSYRKMRVQITYLQQAVLLSLG